MFTGTRSRQKVRAADALEMQRRSLAPLLVTDPLTAGRTLTPLGRDRLRRRPHFRDEPVALCWGPHAVYAHLADDAAWSLDGLRRLQDDDAALLAPAPPTGAERARLASLTPLAALAVQTDAALRALVAAAEGLPRAAATRTGTLLGTGAVDAVTLVRDHAAHLADHIAQLEELMS